MAAEVFSGQPATNFGEDDAFVPLHDWDKQQPNPDEEKVTEVRPDVVVAMGKIPFESNFHPEEWGPGISARARRVQSLDHYVSSDQ